MVYHQGSGNEIKIEEMIPNILGSILVDDELFNNNLNLMGNWPSFCKACPTNGPKLYNTKVSCRLWDPNSQPSVINRVLLPLS